MKTENVILDKTYGFAIRIVNLYKFLANEKMEFVLSKQILRSGTSIGANVNESQSAESNPDFIHKLSIAAKEARETNYWLSLLKDTEFINEKMHNSITKDCFEILTIINSIILTLKEKMN